MTRFRTFFKVTRVTHPVWSGLAMALECSRMVKHFLLQMAGLECPTVFWGRTDLDFLNNSKCTYLIIFEYGKIHSIK